MNKPKYYYRIIHDWINRNYGKANFCESTTCKGASKTYEYCLKKGFEHERNRENYLTLCRSCHRLYDMPDDTSAISDPIRGKYNENLVLGPVAKQRKILLIDKGLEFVSGQELANYLGADKSSVYMVANGQRKTLYGHKIRWADANS